MREVTFSVDAWEDFLNLDKKEFNKVKALIKDTQRNGAGGIGHPEPLKGDKKGLYSKEIDKGNRFVFEILGNNIRILGVKGHYDDH
jgi:toxin YoeB